MNNFVASNGMSVSQTRKSVVAGTTFLYRNEIDALREFFVAERDKETGRWRSPAYLGGR